MVIHIWKNKQEVGMLMKRIALVGLNNFNNMGDQIIAETMQYLVQKNRVDKVETYFVDINPYDSYCKVQLPIRFKIFNLIRKLEYFAEKVIHSNKGLYYIQYISWKIKLYRYYKKQLENADAVIFSGGAFIKYRTQELNYLVDMITKISMDKGIPVMMSAMGVEGYSPTDLRCQKLKTALNRPCVKIITTRDNLSLLNEKYIVNKSIITALVGDPAFYIPEYYQKKKKQSDIIGVGIIRSDIFLKYGINYTEDNVMNLYKEIIKELEKRKINWKLFSNGFTSDYQFGVQLLESLKVDKGKYMPRPKSTHEFIEMISNFDAIIGARLHACITAYSLDIPSIGLVWNEKLELFGELIGKKENFINVNQFDAKHIVETLQKNRNDYYDIKQRNVLKGLTEEYIERFITML
ncbi:polysaccharide pyruvyl transferase family protein [Heyndrickxia oleronia]|uniref:Polysaccharide pyruvyl transferase family protein n=1 Tax=Heyndrickxia oleronia TaxID=38875 RepID=A0AAW6SSK2_9BACI|nr:polysaccharide pyruvyl transferase family protein [Heyndrickxia oleronia]MDH5161285.1 polysaccharide pyruvyl transferase family protein [Heyndrickxia oleronia]